MENVVSVLCKACAKQKVGYTRRGSSSKLSKRAAVGFTCDQSGEKENEMTCNAWYLVQVNVPVHVTFFLSNESKHSALYETVKGFWGRNERRAGVERAIQ